MSKIDYNKFSGKPAEDTKPEQTNDGNVETKVTDIPVNEVKPEETTNVEPETTEPEVESEVELLTSGIVTSCVRLNIRKNPNVNSEVVCVVDVNTKVSVDLKESTNAWYKVFLDNGNCGYCMKNYIAIE